MPDESTFSLKWEMKEGVSREVWARKKIVSLEQLP